MFSRPLQTSILNSGVFVASALPLVPDLGGGPTTLVSDTFTDTDTTVLTSHTPDIDDVGGGWSLSAGTIGTIDSNTAITGGNATRECYVIDAGAGSVSITADLRWYQNALVATHYNGIVFRVTGSTDYLFAGFNDTAFVLGKCVGGTYTAFDSSAFTPVIDTWYTIALTITGDDLSATLDGGYDVSATDTTSSGETVVGIISYRNRMRFDNFLVTG